MVDRFLVWSTKVQLEAEQRELEAGKPPKVKKVGWLERAIWWLAMLPKNEEERLERIKGGRK